MIDMKLYYSTAEIRNMFSFSKSTLEREVKKGGFPKPYGKRKLIWNKDEIEAFNIFLTKNDAKPLPLIGKGKLEEIKSCADNSILKRSQG